ncbi:MAG TPA: CYTH domain-containing protein [Candidatus Paceibacterota bacterium]
MKELEVTILDINPKEVEAKLSSLGAKPILDTRFSVDWYGPKGLTHNGDDPWFLRVRTTSDGKSRVTWKGLSKTTGVSREHREIDFDVPDPKEMGEMFLVIGLECYAHQDKDRKSWVLKDWRFDLDQYPNMPAYLEIEGPSEERVQEAIKLLKLEGNKTSNSGERILIQKEYGLDWNNMRF